jgi:hypothetical protein
MDTYDYCCDSIAMAESFNCLNVTPQLSELNSGSRKRFKESARELIKEFNSVLADGVLLFSAPLH